MSYGLTVEDWAELALPLDPDFIEYREGPGNKQYGYANIDYLKSRIRKVDPNFSSSVSSPHPRIVICTLTIKGISHDGEAGLYVPDVYKVKVTKDEQGNWLPKEKQYWEDRHMTPELAHQEVGGAKAAAFRRACAFGFNLGSELWVKNKSANSTYPSKPTSSQPSNNFKPVTAGQIKFLGDLGVPEAVASKLNAWKTKQADGSFVGQTQQIIDALTKSRDMDKSTYNDRKEDSVELAISTYASDLMQYLYASDPD